MSLLASGGSDALLASIVKSSSDAIFAQDLGGTILSWNAGAERLLGYAAPEVIGQPATLLVPIDQHKAVAALISRVERGEVIEHQASVRRRKDGRLVDMSVSFSPIRDTLGAIAGVSSVARDFTQFGQEQACCRSLLRSIRDAVIITDSDDRVTFLNPVAETLTGWAQTDAPGRPLGDIFQLRDEESRIRHETAGTVARRETSRLPTGLVVLARGGGERPVEGAASPILDRHGAPTGTVWTFRDVTASRAAERAAVRVASQLAAIVTGSDDAIIGKDLNGVITSWNSSAEQMFGYTAAEMVGQPITRILPPDRLNEEQDILDRLRRGARVEHFSTSRLRKDGTVLRVSITVSPIRDERGRIVGASKIARDITSMYHAHRGLEAHARELEATVIERTKVLEEMVAELEGVSYSLSHDMRAPIRAIHSFSEIVLEDYGDRLGPEGVEHMRRVISAAGRLDRLIRDVLAFTRLLPGDAVMTRVDADALVRGLVREMPELAEPNATIRVDPLPAVMGHETLLTQCMANLLDNAVKFVRPRQRPDVHVYAEQRDGVVRLCVRDNGIGMDPEGQRRIFAMFERLPTKSTYAGTGLGLAIVRKAAERMGGSAGAESEPGVGSTFWVELSRADA